MASFYENMIVPTYVINHPERKDMLTQIQLQFAGKNEFDVITVEACPHLIGTVGLWKSILKIIQMAIARDDDVIIICEAQHKFTKYYSKEYLFRNIIEAVDQGVEILAGGIANFSHAVPVSKHRLWINSFSCTQFIIVYKNLFRKLLEEPFEETDTVDAKLSEITSHKMTLIPFVSFPKSFGDVNTKVKLQQRAYRDSGFRETEKRLKKILRVKELYSKHKIGKGNDC